VPFYGSLDFASVSGGWGKVKAQRGGGIACSTKRREVTERVGSSNDYTTKGNRMRGASSLGVRWSASERKEKKEGGYKASVGSSELGGGEWVD